MEHPFQQARLGTCRAAEVFSDCPGPTRPRHGCLERLLGGIWPQKIAERGLAIDRTGKRGARWSEDSRPQGNNHTQVRPDPSSRQKTRSANRITARVQQKSHASAGLVALRILVCSGCSRLQHRQNRHGLNVAGGDSLEMRADAAQLRSYKSIDKMQAPVEPGKQLVLDLIVNRKRDFSA